MKQGKTLIMALFLILTVTVTCGAVEPAETNSPVNSTLTSERTTILDVESAQESEHGIIISAEELTPQKQTSEEDGAITNAEPDIVELDNEEAPNAGPIHSDLRSNYTDSEDTTEPSNTENDSELLEDQDGIEVNDNTEPIQSGDSSLDTEPSQVDDQSDAQADQVDSQDSRKTGTPSEHDDSTDIASDNDNGVINAENANGVNDDNDDNLNDKNSSEIDNNLEKDSGKPQDEVTSTNDDTMDNSRENTDQDIPIEIKPETSPKENSQTNDPLPKNEKDRIEQRSDAHEEVTTENETSDQSIDHEANTTNESSTDHSAKTAAKDQFTQEDGVLAKAIFLAKEFSLWLNEIIVNLF